MWHLYPVNDEQEHDLDSTMCPCNPRVEWEDPETGEPYAEALVIHNAFDCREVVEQAEEIAEKLSQNCLRLPGFIEGAGGNTERPRCRAAFCRLTGLV